MTRLPLNGKANPGTLLRMSAEMFLVGVAVEKAR
jgi:hypothetical protein